MTATDTAIVGRDAELAAIDDFITDPARVALLVEGEPGIGKTTLWLHAARAAELRGHRVLRAEPAEREAKLSYAALTDLIGPVYDVGRGELPEPQQRALDAALLRSAGSANARTIGSALVNFLGALARTDPVVLAIDDAQWLDRASTAGLEFAARRLPTGVKLLLARRPGAEAPLGLDRDSVTRIEVGPLSLGGIHHLLRTHLGSPPPRPTLARIAQTSGGNPFFALELARAPAGHAPGVPLTVPESLQELVAGRIEALSSAAREAVLLASAFTRPTVEAVAAPPAALQEAEAAGVLVVERGRIRFSHPLLSAAVYGAAGGAERLELHRRLADLVEDPDERALHLSLSVSSPDEPAAAEIEAAAARAARRGAQDAAAELYRAAHDLTPDVDGAARARRLSGEAAALHAAGSPAQARAAAERAVEAAPHGPARAEALFFLSPIAWIDPGELGPLDCLHLALAEPGLDPRLRGRIHSKLGMYSDGDQRQGVEHAEAAASLLQAELDPGLLAYTLLAVLFFGAQTGRGIHEGLLKRALELEQRAGRESEKSSLVLIWLQCTDAHDGARARHRLEDEWYRDRGEEIWRAEKRSHLALVEFQAGNWALARRLVEQSCAELEPVGSQGPLGMPFWTRARFDVYTGRIEEARATLLPMLADARARPGNAWFTTFLLEVLGFAALTEGDCDAADRAFAELEELLASIGVTVPFAVRPDADHVEAVVGLGEIERARRLLVRFEERHASAPRPWTLQALPRAQALVAAAEGDPTRALSILEQAPVVAELPFEHARNLLVQGSLQRRLKRKRAAAESLGRAFETFTGLGSPDWARRARDELDRVGLRRGDPYELTETERRVAELAASGMTNREVAQAAFVSPKTVEANLARVYRKLGIRSRAELGASMSARQP